MNVVSLLHLLNFTVLHNLKNVDATYINIHVRAFYTYLEIPWHVSWKIILHSIVERTWLHIAPSPKYIMSALACADLLKSARACLASQSDQPAGPSVLPPFLEKKLW